MPDHKADPHVSMGCGSLFPATQWSAVAMAGEGDSPAALNALEQLARAYWKPLYAYLRGANYPHERARDEVQGFFLSLITRESLRGIEVGGTRFRSFILGCLKKWLASSARHEFALKRGGGITPQPLHELASGLVPAMELSASPEEAMDRTWAKEVFNRAFERLADDAEQRGRAEIFQTLRPILLGGTPLNGYAGLGQELNVAEGTARKMVFDLRVRLGEFLRDEVSATVSQESEIESELRYLLSLL